MPNNGRAEKTTPWVLIALIVVAVVGTISLTVVLTLGGPNATGNAQLIGTFLGPTMVGLLIAVQGNKTHNLVNSTATELRDVTNQLARAEGETQGIAKEAARPARQKDRT